MLFEKKSLEKNFWKDKNSAQKTIKEKNFFEDILNNFLKSQKEVENLLELYQLASTENNKDVIDECEKNLDLLLSETKITEAKCFLSNENDSFDSYFSRNSAS